MTTHTLLSVCGHLRLSFLSLVLLFSQQPLPDCLPGLGQVLALEKLSGNKTNNHVVLRELTFHFCVPTVSGLRTLIFLYPPMLVLPAFLFQVHLWVLNHLGPSLA